MNRELIKGIIIPVITMMTSAVLFYLMNAHSKIFSIGRLMRHCTQDPLSSFPCHAIYDIYALAALTVIFTLALLTAIIKIIVFVRANKKRQL